MEGYTVIKVYTITASCYICENVSRWCEFCLFYMFYYHYY